jgi:hypothetical protein
MKFNMEKRERRERKRRGGRRQTVTANITCVAPYEKGCRVASNVIAKVGVIPSNGSSCAAQIAQSCFT